MSVSSSSHSWKKVALILSNGSTGCSGLRSA
jgi:hypothetical protein